MTDRPSREEQAIFQSRLRTRLALLALVVVVPALVVVAYDQARERRRAREQAEEDLRVVARVAAIQQGAFFEAAHGVLVTVAELRGVRDASPATCSSVLSRILRTRPSYTNLWLYDAAGVMTCSAVPVDTIRVDTRPRWLDDTRITARPTISDYRISPITGRPAIVLAHPIAGPSGQVEGILAVGLQLDQLDPTVSLVPGMSAMLSDRNGTVLTRYPREESLIGRRQPEALAHAARHVVTAPIETEGVDGVRRLYVTARVGTPFDTGLSVSVGIEPATAFAEANALLRRHLWLLAMLTLLTIWLAVAGGHQFVLRPIEALTSVTKRIAGGDFGARAQLDRGVPGLGELAHAVNTMSAALAARERDRAEAERALRNTEERMRFALASAQVGVWEANLRTGDGYWSESCEPMHGLAPGTFGRTADAVFECIHPEDRDHVRATTGAALRERRETFEFDYRALWPDGTVRHHRVAGRIICDDTGAPDRAAGIVIDVTERRRLEDDLRQTHKMEAVGQLAGGIAHDFNNILMAILGNAEMALDELSADDVRRQYLEEIRAAGRDAARLTQQLLAFSRRQVLKPRVIRLGDVITETAPMLRRLLGETIDLRTTTGDDGSVEVDVGQMQQVIVNLAVNARDSMPDGGRLTIQTTDVMLDVSCGVKCPPGPYVRLTVADTGHGMAAAVRQRIFEPFFTTKSQGRGTGLGLATVQGIVQQSRGHISVDSEAGRGTTFTVYFPRVRDVRIEAEPAVDAPPAGGTETVLLVEDDVMVRGFVHKALLRFGYVVHVMGDARQAIDFGRTYPDTLHAIVTDVVLPDMNGRAMAAQLRQQHPEAQVIYMSGYTDDAIARHGVLDPGTSFLQKPFTADHLGRRLRVVLDAARS